MNSMLIHVKNNLINNTNIHHLHLTMHNNVVVQVRIIMTTNKYYEVKACSVHVVVHLLFAV